ncbi:MAG: hypothetical protein M1292_14215 [Bacteroidetes bacterium]|nr:hypothetical protein [Bacteroidota bacterium]
MKGYDYSKAGWYFITMCVQDRACLFGEIRVGAPLRGRPDPQMILNDGGEMIAKWYYELENKYPGIRCREMVVMPNHFHCIIEIMDDHQWDAHVGAPLRGRPIDAIKSRPIDAIQSHPVDGPQYGPDNKKFGVTVGEMVDWFKTMTTNEYIRGVKNQGWKRFDGKLWQRNYWEHIIPDEDAYCRIATYILQNPSKWHDDQLKPLFSNDI